MDQTRKVQLLQLEIAKEIKRVCEKYDIQYALKGGSLLGAVRHEGFIPWDDDMDFGMERSEYDRFVKIAPKELGEKYFLQTWDSEEHFALPFAKVMLKDTLWMERFTKDVDISHCLYVDIFPIDPLPNEEKKRALQRKKLIFCRQLLLSKNHYNAGNYKRGWKKYLYKLTSLPALFISNKSLKRHFLKVIESGYEADNEYYYSFGSQYHYKKGMMKKEWVMKLKPYLFEGEIFPGPADYDGNLRMLYGDYMKLPPVEKRKVHGVYKSDLSKYTVEEHQK